MKRLLLFAALLSFATPLYASEDAARLRTELEALDYEAVMRDAELLLAAHPGNGEVRALRVVARAARQEATADEVEWMVRVNANDPWSWYASAYSKYYGTPGDAWRTLTRP